MRLGLTPRGLGPRLYIEGVAIMDLFSPWHVILIAAVALLLFGTRRLPEIGHGLGKGIYEFKRALKGGARVERAQAADQKPQD